MSRTILCLVAILLFVGAGCGPQAEPVAVTATSPPPTATIPPPTPTTAPTTVPRPTPWQPEAPEEPCQPSDTRSCQVLFVLPRVQYAAWAANLPEDFEAAGYEVLIASSAETVVYPCPDGSRELEVDLPLTDVNVTDYDAVIFVGGYGCRRQWDEDDALQIARDAVAQEVVLGAIGCGPTILAHAGVLDGVQATVCTQDAAVKGGLNYTEIMEELGAIVLNQGVVRDSLIVTSRPRSWLFVPGVLETIAVQDS